MTVFLLTLAASLAALVGGYTALRSRRWLNMALALTAGLVLGLVTFDLLPEIFEIVQTHALDPVWPMIAMTAGFLLFHELPNPWTMAGAAVVVGSTLVITWREHVLAKRAETLA